MWWKLTVLALITVVLVVGVIPIRTHAVKYDTYNDPPPQTWFFSGLLHNMYFTPTTLALIAGILVVAVSLAFWIVRGAR
jgi:uncharacterized membrane protein